MSNYTEREILVVAKKILEETGEMTTTELKEALMIEMQPDGNDLQINLNRNDTKFEQKVRNMVSHRENNDLLKYCEYRRVGNNGVLRSRALPQFEKGDNEKVEIEGRKEKKRRFIARRVNFEALNLKNQELGLKGEEFVLKYEKGRLNPNLSEKIIHVSVEEGDGAGYDILSYDENGKPKFIEVKTTTGPKDTDFYLTENEKAFIEEYQDQAEIVRVYNFDMSTGKGEILRINGEDFYKKMALQPIMYKVSFI
ncbi:DUF3883 domain-containing protein [Alkalihalobacterium chitinilyticum]|uniref:DUF3883 domain-containing protein n=1 Tax=Alkalihalobacterium chitinilyticum TaxID=2980103 RepID=A0ABT5V8I4_9BACI|nr:DUF3883 domain-containing protein [Alkalihalobacterium chitinilyticum]MDE5411774.1 DUF3883 domain-containing protein [Alkalihalobacterium chitinilyticum]